jgi:tetratricopeptide (TPR) repeat protein
MKRVFLLLLLVLPCSLAIGQDWRSLYASSQQEYNNDNLDLALSTGKECLKSYQSQDGTMSGNYESILRLLSNICYSAGNLAEGLEHCNNELAIKEKTGNVNNLEYANALYNKGSFLDQLKQTDEALVALKQAETIFQQFYSSTDQQLVDCQWKIAGCLYQLKQMDKAFEIYNNTIPNYDLEAGVTGEYISATFDYTNILMDQGEYQQAFDYLLILKDLYEQIGDGTETALALINTNKGLCLHKEGKYKEAEESYSEADSLYKLIKQETGTAYFSMINLRAVNYEKLGDSKRAAELLASIGESGDGSSKSLALSNEGVMRQQKGDIEGAAKAFSEAIALIDKTTDKNNYLETALDLASLRVQLGEPEVAKTLIEESEALMADLEPNNPLQAKYYFTLAGYENKLGKWNESFLNCNKALAILDANGIKNNLCMNIVLALAIHYQDTGDYDKSEEFFLKQLAMLNDAGQQQTLSYATTLNNLGTVKQNKAEFLEAQQYLEKAQQISVSLAGKCSSHYAGVIENLGLALTQLGDYTRAEELIGESIKIRKSTVGEESPLYANSIQNLGRIKQFKGKYQDAEPLFALALKLKKNVYGDKHPEYANALNNSALLYQTMGNFDKAEPLFIEAMGIYENRYGSNHPEYATTLENLATLYKLEGSDEKAQELLEKALVIDKNIYGENHPRYAITLHNLASVYKDLEKTNQAKDLYEQALTIDKAVLGEKHPSYASTLYNLAVLNQEMNQFDQAEIKFKEALSIRKEILGENHPDYAYALYGLAGLYHGMHKYVEAKAYYDEVIVNYLQQIKDFFPSLSENEKGAFYAKIRPVLESYQDFCVEFALSGLSGSKQVVADLFNLQLSTKALLLHSSNKVRNRIFSSDNQKLIADYIAWTEQKEKLSKFLSYSDDELKEKNININILSDEINNLEKALSQQSELFAKDIEQQSFTWQQVQGALDEKQAALEILRITKRYIKDSVMYVALIVKKSSEAPELVILKNGKSLENRYFNYYRNAIKFTVGDYISFEQFWQPVGENLAGIEQVYASTDGIFNKININTLWNNQLDRFVIDEYNVQNLSNTRELLTPSTNESRTPNVAEIFGFPDFNLSLAGGQNNTASLTRASEFGFSESIPELPGTKTEVNKLYGLLQEKEWEANLHLRQEANETKIKAIVPPKLLHIATHGFFKSDVVYEQGNDYGAGFNNAEHNPLFRSGLLLAGSAKAILSGSKISEEDGVLTAYEAMNLNLDNTELVVLSACETGIGEVRNGEGVYGLQRAFMVAGAKSVIMSLWQVDDNTTQLLMINFYNNWLAGANKFEAFKNAQKQLKKQYADPFHWGAFIILGTD